MSVESIVFPENATSSPGFSRYAPLPTIKSLKEDYLHGVDLTDGNGKPMKRTTLERYITNAISLIEHELEATVVPTQYAETHDYRADEYEAWGFIQLKRKPVISVDSVQFRIEKDAAFMDVPDSWIRLENHPGQLQISPTSGGLSSINIGQGTFLPRLLISTPDWPAFFRITYTAGFEHGKMPAAISNLAGLLASIQALLVAGDLILGAGINSESLSIDGLAQSVGSTASGENSAYGARIKKYGEQITHLMKVLRRYYGKSIKSVIV